MDNQVEKSNSYKGIENINTNSELIAVFTWTYFLIDHTSMPIPQRSKHTRNAFLTKHYQKDGTIILHLDGDVSYTDSYYNYYNISGGSTNEEKIGISSSISFNSIINNKQIERTFLNVFDTYPENDSLTINTPGEFPILTNSKKIKVQYHIVKDQKRLKLTGFHAEIPLEYYNEFVCNIRLMNKQIVEDFKEIEQ